MLVVRLQHYVAEHQGDWDVFVQLLTYAYHTNLYRFMGTAPLILMILRHLPIEPLSIAHQLSRQAQTTLHGLWFCNQTFSLHCLEETKKRQEADTPAMQV